MGSQREEETGGCGMEVRKGGEGNRGEKGGGRGGEGGLEDDN